MIHVAGVIDETEAQMLIDCGVPYLGFPLALAYHHEDLSVDDAATIVGRLGSQATFFLITYLDTARDIDALCDRLGVAMVQVHGPVSSEELKLLRRSARPRRILKSLIVRTGSLDVLAQEIAEFAPLVDGFITDTFDPTTGATGATGVVHDWEVSKSLAALSPKPIILAGGLTAENVRVAIETVKPAGVDAHTGLEGDDGRKRRDLVEAFVSEAQSGFSALS